MTPQSAKTPTSSASHNKCKLQLLDTYFFFLLSRHIISGSQKYCLSSYCVTNLFGFWKKLSVNLVCPLHCLVFHLVVADTPAARKKLLMTPVQQSSGKYFHHVVYSLMFCCLATANKRLHTIDSSRLLLMYFSAVWESEICIAHSAANRSAL